VIVLDSSFLIAFHNADDVHHPAAAKAMRRVLGGEWGTALLSEYVFHEVVTVVLLRRNLATAIEVGEILLRAREIEFIAGAEVFVDAWPIFREQRRTKLSFVDAALIAAAEKNDVAAIATFDRVLARVSGRPTVP
jgi:predicted nucleic acid-binding protein